MAARQRFIGFARLGFLVGIPLVAILIIVGVVSYWGFGRAGFGDNFIILADQPPVADRRVFGLLAALVPTGLMLCSLWRLFQMFTVENRSLMGPTTVGHLRGFSLFSVWTVISAFLLSGVMRWAMGVFDNAPLWTHLGFSVTHAAILFGAFIIYVATFLIEEGYSYKQETQEYV